MKNITPLADAEDRDERRSSTPAPPANAGWAEVQGPGAGPPRFPEPEFLKIEIERAQLRSIQRRTNGYGLVWLSAWVGPLVIFGALTILVSDTALKVLFFVLYATVFSFDEAILHETHHRTPFRSLWLNEGVHYIAGLLVFKEPVRDRWLHAAHHSYTYYTEIDPEIATERPPRFWTIGLDFFRLRALPRWLWATCRNAFGHIDPLSRRWVPPSEYRRMIWSSRASLLFYVGVIASAVVFQTWYPVILLFGARVIGAWFVMLLALPEHAGLEENVDDWRVNTRTILMNPLSRLLFWNMNYHLEHHMYPTVPFHALPALHDKIAAEAPAPYVSTLEAWRELLPTLWRQRKEPLFSARRPLPASKLDR